MSELEAWTQEDFCQVLNVPSAHKYESQGGPGIRDIMSCLLGRGLEVGTSFRFLKGLPEWCNREDLLANYSAS